MEQSSNTPFIIVAGESLPLSDESALLMAYDTYADGSEGPLMRADRPVGREPESLEELLAVAEQILPPSEVVQWMVRHQDGLDGRRPIDIVRGGGLARVVEALTGRRPVLRLIESPAE